MWRGLRTAAGEDDPTVAPPPTVVKHFPRPNAQSERPDDWNARMADVVCGNCGLELEELASVAPSERPPCPRCGSTARTFDIRLSGNLRVSGSLRTASVTERLVA